jgi:tetratricopeptide (TPR) repeat protein
LAFTAALLFLVNPVNVEAVAWISGRPCLMATFFILLAFFLHLRVKKDLRDWLLWAASLCYLLSLLSYEIAAAMPLAFVYWDLNQDDNKGWRQTARTHYRRWLPYGLVLAVYVGYRLYRGVSEPGSHPGGGSPMFLNVLDAFLNSPSSPFVAIGFYLKKLFWPWPLNLHIEKVARLPYFILGVTFLLGFAWMLWKRSWPRFWAFWFLSGLLVALLLSFSSFSWTTAAERYVYPSSIAAAVFTSLLVFRVLTSKPRWIAGTSQVLLLCLLLSFGIGTVLRAITWKSNLALIEDTLKKNPDSGRLTSLYGAMLHDIGRTEEAVVYLKKAIELDYISGPARRLGDLENSKKNYAAAESYYLQSLWPFQTHGLQTRKSVRNSILGHKRKPGTYLALANLHRKMLAKEPERRAYHEERIIHYHQAACKLKPNNAFLKYELAKAYLRFGRLDEARKLFVQVSEMEPDTYYGKAAAKLAKAEKMSKDKEVASFQEFIKDLRKDDQRGG